MDLALYKINIIIIIIIIYVAFAFFYYAVTYNYVLWTEGVSEINY